MEGFLKIKRNQVLYSQLTETYYFVPISQQSLVDPRLYQVKGKKIDVTESVVPLVAAAIVGHLRALSSSKAFDEKGRRRLLSAARDIEKNTGIDISAADHEG